MVGLPVLGLTRDLCLVRCGGGSGGGFVTPWSAEGGVHPASALAFGG
ncbi:MAG: hypothetical protein RL216_1789, partial [Pseudomonadota bacterium]